MVNRVSLPGPVLFLANISVFLCYSVFSFVSTLSLIFHSCTLPQGIFSGAIMVALQIASQGFDKIPPAVSVMAGVGALQVRWRIWSERQPKRLVDGIRK